MNTIFKYNANAKYSAKDLRGRHNSNNFSLVDVCLDEKGPSVKIQPPNIFKKHEIFLEAATHFVFTVAAQNIHTLPENFHSLSNGYENIYDRWF